MLHDSLIRIWHELWLRTQATRSSVPFESPYETWLIHAWHDSLIRVWLGSWLRTQAARSSVPFGSPYVTWLIHSWHDSSICYVTHSLLYDMRCDSGHRQRDHQCPRGIQTCIVVGDLRLPGSWKSHVTYKWVTAHINESRMNASSCIYNWFVPRRNESHHIWMSHVPCHLWMSHVPSRWWRSGALTLSISLN